MNAQETAKNADIIRALRDGYGVEDIAVKGIASLDDARRMVAHLRRMRVLSQIVRRKGAWK